MALKRQGMIAVDAAHATYTLTPNPGESILVRNIEIVPTVAVIQYMTVRIARRTVGFFHIGTAGLNQLPFQYAQQTMKTIMQTAQEKGIDFTFPIADGESMVITTTAAWTFLLITYDVYDSADILSTRINGSQSLEYIFTNYGGNAAAITTATTTLLSYCYNPVDFPAFPFGALVPAKNTITLLGIGCPDVSMMGAAQATDSVITDRLKLVREREVLFDELLNGLWIRGLRINAGANTTRYYNSGTSQLGYNGDLMHLPLYFLNSPLVFDAGEELSVYASSLLEGAGATMVLQSIYACMLLNVKHIG